MSRWDRTRQRELCLLFVWHKEWKQMWNSMMPRWNINQLSVFKPARTRLIKVFSKLNPTRLQWPSLVYYRGPSVIRIGDSLGWDYTLLKSGLSGHGRIGSRTAERAGTGTIHTLIALIWVMRNSSILSRLNIDCDLILILWMKALATTVFRRT